MVDGHAQYLNIILQVCICQWYRGVIPCQENQIFSTFEPDPLRFFSNLALHMYHHR